MKIGVVTSLFNSEVTLKLETGALETLKAQGVTGEDVCLLRVPGAFEIPIAAQALLDIKKVDGVVALGAVIRGETSHFDYVCRAVERGCSQLALQYRKPVGFGILTTDTEQQALERVGGVHGHKGKETAQCVLDMCRLFDVLQKEHSPS